jgi:hypothetical protein
MPGPDNGFWRGVFYATAFSTAIWFVLWLIFR